MARYDTVVIVLAEVDEPASHSGYSGSQDQEGDVEEDEHDPSAVGGDAVATHDLQRSNSESALH